MAENFVTCWCQHCGNNIEFDAAQLSKDEVRAVDCPHCHLETNIFIQPPEFIPKPQSRNVQEEMRKMMAYETSGDKTKKLRIICPNTNCRYEGFVRDEGHGIMGIILCVLFLPIGIIYLICMAGKSSCPKCGTRTRTIPNN
jgi:hypothetical protein